MIKKVPIFLLVFLCLLLSQVEAQNGQWTWIKGDSVATLGNYGVLGVSSPSNEPPARYHCIHWLDTSGNFWIFGGAFTNGFNSTNDLWRYKPSTNEWTWMSGPQTNNNTAGVFGTQGIPSVNNFPPATQNTGISWTDSSNNLWLMHKYGDLWKYDIASNEWTWVKGSGLTNQAAVYGTQGVSDNANSPGANNENKVAWIDSLNNLWLYQNSNVWKYTMNTNEWTWVKGNGSSPAIPSYGTKGVPAASNQPFAKNGFIYWQDRNDKFYMGFASFNGITSTLWLYDLATNLWTWISGEQGIGVNSNKKFISKCTASVDRSPGIRIESRSAYNNSACDGLFWFHGGNVYQQGPSSDLWIYSPKENTWRWVWGDSTSAISSSYGTKGISSATNIPPPRQGHSMWVDKKQGVWVFGGLANNGIVHISNDLWYYTPDTNCINFHPNNIEVLVLHPPTDTSLCIGENTIMPVDTSYEITVQPNTGYTFNADTSIITFQPSTTTTYTVIADKKNTCSNTISITFTIVVNNFFLPPFQDGTICANSTYSLPLDSTYHFQFSPSTSVSYTPGDSFALFSPTDTTTYTITGTRFGCNANDTSHFTIRVIPNPIADFIISPSSVLIDSPTLHLINTSQFTTHYDWFIGNKYLGSNVPIHYLASSVGQYCFTLIAYNTLGCSDTAIHCGNVLYNDHLFTPNSFSPNGDGLNDEFHILAYQLHLLHFNIYNRWGEKVFSATDPTFGWDGNYKGEKAPISTYYYFMEYLDKNGEKRLIKGDVTLLR